MNPLSVAEHFDVIEDRQCCLTPRAKSFVMDQLQFERTKEALSNSIIPAVSFPAHTLLRERLLHKLAKAGTGILAPAIGVDEQWCSSPAARHAHRKRRFHQLTRHPFGHRPADHHSRKEIKEDSQVEP